MYKTWYRISFDIFIYRHATSNSDDLNSSPASVYYGESQMISARSCLRVFDRSHPQFVVPACMLEVVRCSALLLVQRSRAIRTLFQAVPQGQFRTPPPKIRELGLGLLLYDIAHMLHRDISMFIPSPPLPLDTHLPKDRRKLRAMPASACADEERVVVPGQIVDQPRVIDAVSLEAETGRSDGQRREVGEECRNVGLDAFYGSEWQRGIVHTRPQRYGNWSV